MFKSLKFLNEGFDRRYLKEEVEEELFHNDNGTDYVIVERSKSGENALLRTQNGKKWIIAWNCPKSNEGSWGQGHYFFDEHEARDLWEKKYLNEDVRREWKPNINFNHIKDVFNKVKANNYKYVNNEREEMSAAVDAADKGKYTPEQRRQIKEWHKEIWLAHKKKTNEDWNMEDQIDAPASIGKLNKGDKFKNRKGVIITITDPTKDGRIQYCVGDECRSGSEKSVQQMLYRNNYVRMSQKKKTNEAMDDQGVERYGINGKWWYFTTHGVQPGSVPNGIKILDTKDGKNRKGTIGTFFASDRVLNTSELEKYDIKEESPVNESLNEDTVKQNGKWVNKGKEGTHGKFATKKAADAQRKAMFANGYKAESLNESEESEKRIVKTVMSGNKHKEILDSIIGQMSDGIWENSPSVEPYWKFAKVDDDCNFVIESKPMVWDSYRDKPIRNPYYQKSDADILKYFANKLKQIVREFANDNDLDFKQLWNKDSTEICDYLGYEDEISTGDAFMTYQALR